MAPSLTRFIPRVSRPLQARMRSNSLPKRVIATLSASLRLQVARRAPAKGRRLLDPIEPVSYAPKLRAGWHDDKEQPAAIGELDSLSAGLAPRMCVSACGIAGADQIPARMPAISLAPNARRYPQANNLGQPCFDFRLFSDAYGQSWTTAKQKVVSRKGFEPLTYGLGNRCSILLSYRDIGPRLA